MKFTDLFIRRPVLATVVSLVILIAGLQSIRSLSVRQFPRTDIAVVTVTTVYVGANADLVRGFITTPLERVIASADGIDYMESSSAQGVSTITVHLKLNYDTNAALTQIQAKVAQVRNDLPPEAQAPVIDLQTADTQFASMYIGFSSTELDQNQITDYLTRVVQPKLSAISGVQRADILGSRTFAMRIWLKPDRMAALGISPSQVRDALANNNSLAAIGRTKGSMVSVNLVANTNLKTAEEFRNLVVKQDKGTIVRLGEIADVVLGAEDYESDVRFNGQGATFMGVWVLPTANTLDVIKRVREAIPGIRAQLPSGMKVGIPYDSTAYIQDAIHEVLKTLAETLLIVIVVIFLFLGSFRSVLIPVVAIPVSLVGAVFLMLVAGFTINLLTLLAIVLSVGLVVDDAIVMVENVERHLHLGETSVRRRDPRGPRARRPDHRHDDHARGGVRADRHPGRPDRRALPGVRLHARRRRDHLRHRRAHALPDDGLEAPARRRHRARLRRDDQPALRGRPAHVRPPPDGHARATGRSSSPCGRSCALLIVPFYLFSQKELAPKEDQGVVFGIIQAAPNATIDQTKLFSSQVHDVYRSFPEAESIFQITSPTAASEAWSRSRGASARRRTAQLQVEAAAQPLEDPRHPRHLAHPAGAAGRRQLSRGLRRRVDRRAGAPRRHRQRSRREGVRRAASSCSPTRT